jgi:hypothetical protein
MTSTEPHLAVVLWAAVAAFRAAASVHGEAISANAGGGRARSEQRLKAPLSFVLSFWD